jgi:uncharacterized membrane protein (UPF0127 family)
LNRLTVAVILVVVIILVTAFSVGRLLIPQEKTSRIEISGIVLTVELAETPSDQERGLSGRDSMAPDHGMLFVFDSPGYWGFWMHEMKFPLDIIWFDSTRQAVFIEQNLTPCTPEACPVYTPTVQAQYVLEVNAGFVRTNNIQLGESFTFVS